MTRARHATGLMALVMLAGSFQQAVNLNSTDQKKLADVVKYSSGNIIRSSGPAAHRPRRNIKIAGKRRLPRVSVKRHSAAGKMFGGHDGLKRKPAHCEGGRKLTFGLFLDASGDDRRYRGFNLVGVVRLKEHFPPSALVKLKVDGAAFEKQESVPLDHRIAGAGLLPLKAGAFAASSFDGVLKVSDRTNSHVGLPYQLGGANPHPACPKYRTLQEVCQPPAFGITPRLNPDGTQVCTRKEQTHESD